MQEEFFRWYSLLEEFFVYCPQLGHLLPDFLLGDDLSPGNPLLCISRQACIIPEDSVLVS